MLPSPYISYSDEGDIWYAVVVNCCRFDTIIPIPWVMDAIELTFVVLEAEGVGLTSFDPESEQADFSTEEPCEYVSSCSFSRIFHPGDEDRETRFYTMRYYAAPRGYTVTILA